MSTEKLSSDDVRQRLQNLPGWTLRDDKLHRLFEFDDFVGAFGFMASAALIAESRQHHPNWSNVWNKVTVDLTTHDAGGLTAKDFDLAEAMSQLAS